MTKGTMTKRGSLRGAIALAIAASAACTSSPTQPASTSGGSSATASIAGGRPSTPSNGALVPFGAQPVTLSVQNATVTSTTGGAVTYTFEVASDSSFATKIQTKDGVAQGTGGQTSVTLDALPGGKDYFWHVRAQGGGTTGVFGSTFKFTVGPAVSLTVPSIVEPLANAQTVPSPTFIVNNVTRTGPAGTVAYRFDIATSATFASLLVSQTVPEGSNGRTIFTPVPDLPGNRTLFWRVVAIDTTNAVTSMSVAQSLTTSLFIDLTKVVYLKGPNLSTWAQTGAIIAVEQDGSYAAGGPMCISFSDPGWPDTKWIYAGPNDDPNFGIYGNQWYFANIGGTWYGGPGEWLYRGAATCKAGQGTTTIGPDSGFGPPFSSWVPKPGELVGYAVSASARALPQMSTVQERTNVVLVPWHDSSLQGFTGAIRSLAAGILPSFPPKVQ